MADQIVLAECFQYTNPANGDLVINALVNDYVALIGKRVCAIDIRVNTHQNILNSLAQRVSSLESEAPVTYTLPVLYPTGIANPNVALSLEVFTAMLEVQFVQQRSAVGTVTDIFDVITVLSGQNSSKALGTSGGNLSALPGWVPSVNDLADLVKNAALMILDLRSAVTNMKLSCCTGTCNSVEIAVQATFANRILTLFFTGNIPTNLVNAFPTGWPVKIEDQSGHYVIGSVDIKGNLNVVSGIALDLTSAPLNFADDLKVSGVYTLVDNESGTQCQKYLEKSITNNSSCPTVTLSSGMTSISYNFIHVEGSLTYSVQLYTMNNVQVQTYNVAVSAPMTIQGTFNGLASGTSYKVRVELITAESSRLCPFTIISTLPIACPAPNGVTVTIEY